MGAFPRVGQAIWVPLSRVLPHRCSLHWRWHGAARGCGAAGLRGCVCVCMCVCAGPRRASGPVVSVGVAPRAAGRGDSLPSLPPSLRGTGGAAGGGEQGLAGRPTGRAPGPGRRRGPPSEGAAGARGDPTPHTSTHARTHTRTHAHGDTHTDTETHPRQAPTHTETHTLGQTHTHTHTETQTHTDRHADRQTQRGTRRNSHTHRHTPATHTLSPGDVPASGVPPGVLGGCPRRLLAAGPCPGPAEGPGRGAEAGVQGPGVQGPGVRSCWWGGMGWVGCRPQASSSRQPRHGGAGCWPGRGQGPWVPGAGGQGQDQGQGPGPSPVPRQRPRGEKESQKGPPQPAKGLQHPVFPGGLPSKY